MVPPIARLAVTGSCGFIGARLCRQAAAQGIELLPVSSRTESPFYGALERQSKQHLPQALVHLAARVHVMNESATDPMSAYRRANAEGTLALARTAAQIGVRRFVFVSSVKVNGESTPLGQPFQPDPCDAPNDPYGRSKWEAEQALRELAITTGMEVVIVRPPLVYGPGVKANFESMMRWLARDFPLPLAAVTQNRRSFVALDNLVDFIMTCLSHRAAANQTFLVSDGEDLSTAGLLRRMGVALGHPARLFYVPPSILQVGAQILNKEGTYQRLCGSLQLDITKTRHLLGWTPPFSVDEGLQRAAEGFRA